MQKSKFNVGDKVAVYIDNLRAPRSYNVLGTVEDFPHGQIGNGRGIPAFYDPAGSTYERDRVAEATVVEKDARRLTSRYGNTYKAENDGVLVEFAEPVTIGHVQNEPVTVKTAVVTSRFIIEPWDVVVARRIENDERKAKQKNDDQRKARQFEPVLNQFIDDLASIGLNATLHNDASGLHGDVNVSLYRAGSYDDRKPTGFGYHAEMPTAIFRELVKIAAKHGEKVAVNEDEEE
jgi:hypothetical protein